MQRIRNKILEKEVKAGVDTAYAADFFEALREYGWAHIRTVEDIIVQPVLVLDRSLSVVAANEAFYKTFQTDVKNTEKQFLYELGNGQWNIPALIKQLESIIPKDGFFKGFEVTHIFPIVGEKSMMLTARQIFIKQEAEFERIPPIILLTMEDVTDMMNVAKMFSTEVSNAENKNISQTRNLENHIAKLEEEIAELKKNK